MSFVTSWCSPSSSTTSRSCGTVRRWWPRSSYKGTIATEPSAASLPSFPRSWTAEWAHKTTHCIKKNTTTLFLCVCVCELAASLLGPSACVFLRVGRANFAGGDGEDAQLVLCGGWEDRRSVLPGRMSGLRNGVLYLPLHGDSLREGQNGKPKMHFCPVYRCEFLLRDGEAIQCITRFSC